MKMMRKLFKSFDDSKSDDDDDDGASTNQHQMVMRIELFFAPIYFYFLFH